MSSSSKTTLSTANAAAKITSEPQKARRSTKTAHKLKVLPEQPAPPTQSNVPSDNEADDDATVQSDEGQQTDPQETTVADLEGEAEVYKQIAQIEPGTARRDALRLTKKQKAKLPRVTAYCTANSYKIPELKRFLHARSEAYHTDPQAFDEVLYSPYSYHYSSREPPRQSSVGDLLGHPELVANPHNGHDGATEKKKRSRFDGSGEDDRGPEVFLFEYGVVVIWGMTIAEERRFLSSIRRFETERLDQEEMEDLNFYYANYSRIYNDVITLRRGSSYMTKLALSHALAQSVKISVFEELIATTIDDTKDIPEVISETGKIGVIISQALQ